jgi:hypothetical protein
VCSSLRAPELVLLTEEADAIEQLPGALASGLEAES